MKEPVYKFNVYFVYLIAKLIGWIVGASQQNSGFWSKYQLTIRFAQSIQDVMCILFVLNVYGYSYVSLH